MLTLANLFVEVKKSSTLHYAELDPFVLSGPLVLAMLEFLIYRVYKFKHFDE